MAINWSEFTPVDSGAKPSSGGVDWSQFEPIAPEKDPGYLGEAKRGLIGGAMVQLPKMAGEALKFFGANETGDSLISGAEARNTRDVQESAAGQAENSPYSVRGNVYEAASNAVPSLAPGAAGAAVGAGIGMLAGPGGAAAGALLGYAVGSIASLPMFYGSQAQNSYEAVKKTQIGLGKSESEADSIARATAHVEGSIEAGGELASDVIPFVKLFKPLAKVGTKAVGRVVKDIFFPGIKSAAKTVGGIVASEVGTEMAQQAGEDYARKAIGDTGPGATWEETSKVIMPTALMSLIPGMAGAGAKHVQVGRARDALENPETDPEIRAKIAAGAVTAMQDVSPDTSRAFSLYAGEQIAAGKPIELSTDSFYLDYAKPKLALPAPTFNMPDGAPVDPDAVRASEAAEARSAQIQTERAAEEARVNQAFSDLNIARTADDAIEAAQRAAFTDPPGTRGLIASAIERQAETAARDALDAPAVAELSVQAERDQAFQSIERDKEIGRLLQEKLAKDQREAAIEKERQTILTDARNQQGAAVVEQSQAMADATGPDETGNPLRAALTGVADNGTPIGDMPDAQLLVVAKASSSQARRQAAQDELVFRKDQAAQKPNAGQVEPQVEPQYPVRYQVDEKGVIRKYQGPDMPGLFDTHEAARTGRIRQLKAARRPNPGKDSLNEWISARGGVAMTERADTIGEGNKAYKGGQWLFRREGQPMDLLAESAHSDGFLTDEEYADGGGVEVLRRKIGEEFNGQKQHLALSNNQQQDMEADTREERDIMDAANQAGIPTDGLTLDQIKDAVTDFYAQQAALVESEAVEEARLEREALQADNLVPEENDDFDIPGFDQPSLGQGAQAVAGSDQTAGQQPVGQDASAVAQGARYNAQVDRDAEAQRQDQSEQVAGQPPRALFTFDERKRFDFHDIDLSGATPENKDQYLRRLAETEYSSKERERVYNEKARNSERDVVIRRLQSDSTVSSNSGKPFKTEATAKAFSKQWDLGDTHEVSKTDGGFILRKLGESNRPSAIAAQQERMAKDPATQRQNAQFARAEKIGAAADDAVTAYENGDIEPDEFDARLDAAERPPLDLAAQSSAEAVAEAERLKKIEEDKAKTEAKAEADAKQARIDAEIKSRQAASAENFQLGQSAEDSLAGQGDIFNQPAPKEMSAADHLRAAAAKIDQATKPAQPAEASTATEPKPLYASRVVLNADAIIAWAKEQGFKSTLPSEDMHVTVAYSKTPMVGSKVPSAVKAVEVDGGERTVEPLGDEGAVVLKFSSPELQSRWKQYRDAGASWDYEKYTPHITLTYKGADVDLSKVTPYAGPINLGPEKQEPLNEDKAEEYKEQPTTAVSENSGTNIADFGEKIGGARKDTAKPLGERSGRGADESNEPGWRKRFSVYQIAKSTREFEVGRWAIADDRTDSWRGQMVGGKTFATEQEANNAVPLIAVALKHRAVTVSDGNGGQVFEIWRDVTDRKRVKVVDQQFATRDDAMKYMAEHAVQIIEKKTNFGEEILAKPDTVVRTGVERRTGPATKVMFEDTFGFRGVEFGKWNNQDERQEVMNHAYDGLLDLADVLHIPAKAISLNGELALAFGARGQGLSGARAHYETDYGVINLTKMTGAGALAHEWFHAADHYLARQDTKAKSGKEPNKRGDLVYPRQDLLHTMASHGFRATDSKVRKEVRDAYENVIKTMFKKAEKYVEDTEKAEKFVGQARNRLAEALQEIRDTGYYALSKAIDPTYRPRKKAAATSEQLAQFDALAERLIAGQDLAVETRYTAKPGTPAKARGGMSYRRTNDTLEALNAIIKEVRGRNGFSSEGKGELDGVRYLMGAYAERINMLESARSGTEKTKGVPTSYAMESKKIDQGRASDYWTTEHEMAARAFSAYVEDKVSEQGNKSDFLSYGSNNNQIEYRMLQMRPFPEGAERAAINEAFDKLFQVLDTRETDRGVALFRRGESANQIQQDSSQSIANVKEWIAPVESRLTNIPEIRVVYDASEIPGVAESLKSTQDKADAGDSIAQNAVRNNDLHPIEGVYANGQVWLVAKSLTNRARALRVLAHEAVGHLSVEQMLDATDPALFARLVRQVMVLDGGGNAYIRSLGEIVDKSQPGLSKPMRAKEIIALIAERGDQAKDFGPTVRSLWQKISDGIKAFFKLAFDVDLTDQDVRDIVVLAERWAGGEDHVTRGLNNALQSELVFARSSDESRAELADRIDAVLRGEMGGEPIYLGNTPAVLQRLGMKALPMGMTESNADKSVFDHGILAREMKSIADMIADPVAVFDSASTPGTFVVVTDLVKSDGRPVIVAIHPNREIRRVASNEVKSMYPRNDHIETMTRWFRDNLRYVNNGKRPEWQRFTGLQLPEKMPTRSAGQIVLTEGEFVKSDLRAEFADSPWRKKDSDGEPMFSRGTPSDRIEPDEIAQKALADSPAVKVAGKWKSLVKTKAAIHEAIDRLSPLGKLPLQEEYLVKRYRALGRIAVASEETKDLYAAFRDAGEHAPDIYAFLTNKDALPSVIKSEEYRDRAVKAKQTLIDVGQKLVDQGLLPKEVFEAHRGEYLPRIYLRHLLDDDAISALSSGKKPSDMGYLKARKDIPDDVRRLILGEITDPAYLVSKAYGTQMRDIALLDWLAEIATERDWVLAESLVDWDGKQVTPFWLKQTAKQIRTQSVHYSMDDRKQARAIADNMDEVADKALGEYAGVPDGWKQIPDTPRYGRLRGLIVRQEIFDDIVGAARINPTDASVAEKILGNGGLATKFTQLWKWSKVAANPPAQIRNFVSNGVLLHLSGVSFHMIIPRTIEAIREIRTNGKHWKIAKKYGVTESTFSAQELFRIESDFLDMQARGAGIFSFATAKNLASKVMSFTGDIYQLSEAVFKTAKIIDGMKKGKTEEQAMLDAQKWMFDYSLVTPSMRYLRNAPIGAPFITFYFKALPRLLEVATTHPLRLAPYLAIPFALTAMLASMADVDDDDVDRLKKALPEWLQERGNAHFLPMKDDKGRWMAMDIGYFLPWSMWQELGTELAKGEFGKAMQSSGMLGGPVPDLIAAIKNNKDPFSKKEIVSEYDPPAKQIASIMGYLYSMAMPTWLTNYGFSGHMYNALNETVDKHGEVKSTAGQATLRLFGVNLYSINPEQTRAENIRRMRYEIQEQKRRRTMALRDRNLTPEQRKEVDQEFRELIQKRSSEVVKYTQESRVHPNLSTGAPR